MKRSSSYIIHLALGFAVSGSYLHPTECFTPSYSPHLTFTRHVRNNHRVSPLWYISTELPDLSEMKASEMKKELESYGISTKSLFDKNEFEKALREERANQMNTDVESIKDRINRGSEAASSFSQSEKKKQRENSQTDHASSPNQWKTTAQSSPPKDSSDSKYHNAFQEGISMKLSELKQELKDRGISTSAFFEKVEMAKAYAQAVADNVFKKEKNKVKDATSSRTSEGRNSYRKETFDPSYRDVQVKPFNAGLTILPGETVIDITDLVKGMGATENVWQ
ncbi:SAP domain containing protein [Nitzschia inconspicua]|uniref:SAP domain containing protein n=1 Tax=Nitzschia inconspicua TaxID=303405 RepID=A0A9K3Q4E6_9STRA|nr:SAP domain containing protein [Nitzschia inconspicua]